MVYRERTEKCLATSNDKSGQNKATPSKPPASPSSSSSSWSSQASSADKWKYNDMVKNNRDKFNSMHFS